MLNFIVGLIGITIGIFLVIKTEWFLEFFGRIEWAELHLGTEGGTRIFYKILGVTIIVISFMFMTGMVQTILRKIFTNKGGGV